MAEAEARLRDAIRLSAEAEEEEGEEDEEEWEEGEDEGEGVAQDAEELLARMLLQRGGSAEGVAEANGLLRELGYTTCFAPSLAAASAPTPPPPGTGYNMCSPACMARPLPHTPVLGPWPPPFTRARAPACSGRAEREQEQARRRRVSPQRPPSPSLGCGLRHMASSPSLGCCCLRHMAPPPSLGCCLRHVTSEAAAPPRLQSAERGDCL